MIEWRKWSKDDELEINKLCLVMRRSSAFPVVTFYQNEGEQRNQFIALGGYAVMDVTHWSPINLPGEEEA
ncbi:hypothetical protein [Paenibacillus sp. LK1]|uniref:hypothetical protein n=1 Tax=Paenibacillus sp. LK1 TaxID=2053014 RepID=UPI000C1A5E20|nr:hypothetical protein [Paenibacillus sp. LK1]PIH58264.1 hypothetical protein CS562_17490 [Paenibacillus sp. LK1]